jgi:hypothetical protein
MKDHPKYGKIPTNLKELEIWLARDVRTSCGGALYTAEFYLEIISSMIDGKEWNKYFEEINS